LTHERPTSQVLLRYALFQLPGTALLVGALVLAGLWVEIPLWLSALIVGLWVVKEIVLFPLVWRAYDVRCSGGAHTMLGVRGKAEERLDPRGYVRLRGELWQAELAEGAAPVEAGAEVVVLEVKGLVVIVRHP